MKLYFFPGACSLAPHIALREAGLKFETEKVDLKAKKTASGGDYLAVNPKGYVPALTLDNGQTLTEAGAIVQYIADQAPAAKLAPAAGTMDRYRVHEWLGYINSEVHKGFGPFFVPGTSDEAKATAKANLGKRFGFVQQALEGREFLVGDQFTVADAYLFTVLGWTRIVGIDLGEWPVLKAWHAKIAHRPAVQAAMRAEGLIK